MTPPAFEPVNVRDVRMVEGREHLRFALEARNAIRVLRDGVRQDFQRDITSELRIARAIDLAHPACA